MRPWGLKLLMYAWGLKEEREQTGSQVLRPWATTGWGKRGLKLLMYVWSLKKIPENKEALSYYCMYEALSRYQRTNWQSGWREIHWSRNALKRCGISLPVKRKKHWSRNALKRCGISLPVKRKKHWSRNDLKRCGISLPVSYYYIRPWATKVWGLKLLMYTPLS